MGSGTPGTGAGAVRWVVGTAAQKLVESRSRVDGRIVGGPDVRIPVEPFHAVPSGQTGADGLCGAPVRWVWEEMDFGTRAQNCPRCTAALAGRSTDG